MRAVAWVERLRAVVPVELLCVCVERRLRAVVPVELLRVCVERRLRAVAVVRGLRRGAAALRPRAVLVVRLLVDAAERLRLLAAPPLRPLCVLRDLVAISDAPNAAGIPVDRCPRVSRPSRKQTRTN